VAARPGRAYGVEVNDTGEMHWLEVLEDVLGGAHLWRTDQLAGSVAAAVARLGLRTTIWLVDYEQVALRALPQAGQVTPAPLPVDGSLPGRAFARVTSIRGDDHRWWVPMVDGTDRLGVVEFVADGVIGAGADFLRRCEILSGLVGHLIATTSERGDHLDRIRRSRQMSTASELLWHMLPPLTASSDSAVVSAVLQPCYEVGGDGFDYALDGSAAHLVILDAVGKGVTAGVACAVALAAVRAARRGGRGLHDQARAADAAVAEQFPDGCFVTAVLAELRLDSGRLRYLNAGHPEPLLLRAGRLVRTITDGRRLPLGLDDPQAHVAEVSLEPEDRLLLYTDGVTEARDGGREFYPLDEGLARHVCDDPSRTLDALHDELLDHVGGRLHDDAALLLIRKPTPSGPTPATGPGGRDVATEAA
jgi:hypothetical protein